MRIAECVYFYPRGGSAHAVRAISAQLQSIGHKVAVAAGSLGGEGAPTHAPTFYGPLLRAEYCYDGAVNAHTRGDDPFLERAPMHVSYEDVEGAPDADASKVPFEHFERQVVAWAGTLASLDREFTPEIVHAHHLGPLNVAAQRLWPTAPHVVSLHGTEIKWLASNLRSIDANATKWWEVMAQAARSAQAVVTLNNDDREFVVDHLGVASESTHVIQGGVDPLVFHPDVPSEHRRENLWETWLRANGYDAPSARSTAGQLAKGVNGCLPILCVSRNIPAKRLDLLIHAYGSVRYRLPTGCPPLVIWGAGSDHEVKDLRRLVRDRGLREHVHFFQPTRQHDVAVAMNCSSLLALPSIGESFGQVFYESLACGVPVIATTSGGPGLDLARLRPEVGWFAATDDAEDLSDRIFEAVIDPASRSIRGAHGRQFVARHRSWRSAAVSLAHVFTECARLKAA